MSARLAIGPKNTPFKGTIMAKLKHGTQLWSNNVVVFSIELGYFCSYRGLEKETTQSRVP
jgi:hypothetical protein